MEKNVKLGGCKGCPIPLPQDFIDGASGKKELHRYIVATGQIPHGTAAKRDFSHFYSDIVHLNGDKCTACMKCMFICPDSALHPFLVEKDAFEKELAKIKDEKIVKFIRGHIGGPVSTKRYEKVAEGKELVFLLATSNWRCKSCGLCVEVCPTKALNIEMKHEIKDRLGADPEYLYTGLWNFALSLRSVDKKFITTPLDTMLDHDAVDGYTGGAGSCWGCGETPFIRMTIAETIRNYGPESMVIVAATGCNTVYGSMYPWNPFNAAWMNSLFENACEEAMGIRLGFDQQGLTDKKIWVFAGDGAMYDIGFGGLSRMLSSGLDIKVLVLDSQAYSNTGGQASTATPFMANAKMAPAGKVIPGKREVKKELGLICMAHPNTYVAQVSLSSIAHIQKAIKGALEYDGPAVVIAYTPCIPEHGIPKNSAVRMSQLAVESREFPLFIFDPRKGDTFSGRIDLGGNPSIEKDWHTRDGIEITPEVFAKEQGRFSHLFRRDDTKEVIETLKTERLRFWHSLQDLADVVTDKMKAEQKEEVKAKQPTS